MRVTQFMLSQNSLRHINQGYQRLGILNDQFTSGKKITRASQDPVVAMSGIRYRTQVVEVEQFQRNLGEVYNWMDTADATLDKVGKAIHRIRELAVLSPNDTYESTQRANVAKEINQLFDHIVSLANTKSNGKYIFNGTDTMNPPIDETKMNLDLSELSAASATELEEVEISYQGHVYKFDSISGTDVMFTSVAGNTITVKNYADPNPTIETEQPNPEFIRGTSDPAVVPEKITLPLTKDDIVISKADAVSTNKENVNIELLKGVTINVNIDPNNVFSNALFGDIKQLIKTLENPEATHDDLTKLIDNFDVHLDNIVSERAELGARVNRVELIEERLGEQEIIANRIMSNNEDIDMEKVIIDLKTQEVVHRAALAAGARIMQPTLLDFLR